MTDLLILALAVAIGAIVVLGRRLNLEAKKSRRIATQIESSAAEAHIARARLLASISNLTIGFIMTDENSSILLINNAAINLLCNLELEHVKVVASAAPKLNFQCTIEEITEELHQGFDLKAEIKKCLQSRAKSEFAGVVFRSLYLHVRLSPVVVDNKAIGAVVLVEDVTDMKNLERSKDEFFSIASHELRTPLTAIRGNAEMIEQYHAPLLKNADLKEMINDIKEASVRLIGIVNDYLNVSRLEQKRISFVIKPFDLAKLAAKVVKDLQATAKEKNLILTVKSPAKDNDSIVNADEARTEEVIINLVGNAIKYTEKGTVAVEIQPTFSTAKFLVSDTGRGIPPESQGLLFKKFSQATSNLYVRDPAKSTGLGLYISKLLIAGMGGIIKLDQSTVGQGSTFSFVLPRPNLPIPTQPLKTVLSSSKVKG